MKTRRMLLAPPALAIGLLAPGAAAQEPAVPPAASKKPHEMTSHGHTRVDDYFWMRDKSSPEVIKHLEAENAYTESVMAPTKPLREALYAEMLGRIKQTDLSVPSRIGEYLYYSRTEEGKQYPYLCRRKGSMTAPEEILLDLNALAEGQKYLGLGAYRVSDDGNLLAYSTDTTGYRQYVLHVKDLRTGKTVDGPIERTGSIVWAADHRTLFYTTEDPVSKRSNMFWRRTVGSGRSELLYEEKDELFDIGAGRSLDRKVIFLGSYAKTSREFRYLRADDPGGSLRLVLPREPDHEFEVDHDKGEFYITTNRGAKNFRVVRAPMDDPSEKNWKPFIDHNPAIKVEHVTFFADFAVVAEREGGLMHLRVIDAKTGESRRIDTPEQDYALSLGSNPEYDTSTVRFNYTSMVTPQSVYEYDMATGARTLLKQQEVLGGFDPKAYEAKRIWSVSRDGTNVPISLVHRKGVKPDGTAPLLLYGYGSYGASLAPTFSSNRVSLLDRGVIFAIAYVRGGGELGEEWREAGRMMRKLNTFYDFVDAAEFLVKSGYTSPDRLVIQGGSAGGLLVGAAMNLRPDLFKAVVAQVPFVDVVNTMLDASLPLTTSEYTEWGNPSDKAAFDYMLKYSPYDNIRPVEYPALLVEVSLNDSQVPYWEGAKFATKLRAATTGKNPVLLKTNMGAGHGGASGRYDALRETAFTYAFVLWQMGLAGAGSSPGAAPR